jgi:PIN domain nuclease of toxin-antitoxin system
MVSQKRNTSSTPILNHDVTHELPLASQFDGRQQVGLLTIPADNWLPISNARSLAAAALETDGVHRDPFDRLLVCHSRMEPGKVMS